MAISGHHGEAGLRNNIVHPLSEQLRACSDILSYALSGRSHQSQGRIVNFDGLTFLTALVLFNQSDYLTILK